MVLLIVVDGFLVFICKFKKDKLGIDDFVGFGVFFEEMVVYLQVVVVICLNVIVFGGIGFGKMMIFNVFSFFIDNVEWIFIIEDIVEF